MIQLHQFKMTQQSLSIWMKRLTFIGILVSAFVVGYALNVYLNTHVNENDRVSQDCMKEVAKLTSAQALGEMGDAYFGGARGYDLTCARKAYERAVSIDVRGYPTAWYQMGRIDFLHEEYNGALIKLAKQQELFGDDVPNVHYMFGLTYGYSASREGNAYKWNRAEEGFTRFLDFFPENPWGRTDLAWILFSQGKFHEMKPVLEKGLETHPRHPWLLNMYGLALLNTGERERAHEYFIQSFAEAELLTPESWGASYPGNDPKIWETGLREMQRSIAHNIEISKSDE